MDKYSLHDFDDGRGPVPAHQHSNGGGWVENTATVASTAYVGPHAQVRLFGKVLDRARVEGQGLVTDSAVVKDKAICRGEARCETMLHGRMILDADELGCGV